MHGDADWGIWSWAGTATQTNVAGGAIQIDVTAGNGNVVHILYAQAVGVFAAADDLALFHLDEDNNSLVDFASVNAIGTLRVTYPRANTDIDSTTSNNRGTALGPGLWLAGTDLKFNVFTSALAQNDTVQLLFQAKVKNGPGSISVARSGGTVAAIVPTVNEVY